MAATCDGCGNFSGLRFVELQYQTEDDVMAKPRTHQDELDDTTRVDSFRTDEDTGGAAAPPLRPRDDAASRKRREHAADRREDITKRDKR